MTSRLHAGFFYCLAGALFLLLYSCSASNQAPVKRPVKQCFDCHSEFEGRFIKANVHAPVKEENCYSCHMPHGLYGKIVFRQAQPNLCYTCHADTLPAVSAASVHEPVATDKCTVCHDPHNSDFGGLLKDDGDESCFSCHDREPYQRKYVHQALATGCRTCHVPHSSENVTLLKMSPDETCRECHAVMEDTFKNAHFSYPVVTGCIDCHSPHSSSTKQLLKINVHDPVREGECNACHSVKGKTIAINDKADKLCLGCHAIHKDAKTVHQPYIAGQCTSCHDVHASDFKVLLVKPPEKVCLDCHAQKRGLAGDDDAAEATTKVEDMPHAVKPISLHKPFGEGLCLDCHLGHVSEQSSMLKKSIKSLCYDCHEQNQYSGTGSSHPPKDADRCDTCHVPHQSGVRMLLADDREQDLCFSCHRNTRNERGKFSLHKPFSRGECGQCHQLHRPKAPAYLSQPYATGEICLTCHEQPEQDAGKITGHQPVTSRQCNKCHLPHSADNEHVMRLPEGEQCYICHQDVKNALAGMKVTHKPVNDGKCTSCHVAHGSTYASMLKKNQPALCITCHLDVAQFWLDGFPHEPAIKDCLQCHRSHGSNLPAALVKPSGTLCSDCHDVKTEGFIKNHGQIMPGPESCVTCHDPHGSPDKSMLYPVMHNPFAEGTCSPCHSGGKK